MVPELHVLPTPSDPASTPPRVYYGVASAELGKAIANHPAGKGRKNPPLGTDSLLELVRGARHDEIREAMRRTHDAARAELQEQLDALEKEQGLGEAILDYRLGGGTLEGLGDLAKDSAVSEWWSTITSEYDL